MAACKASILAAVLLFCPLIIFYRVLQTEILVLGTKVPIDVVVKGKSIVE